MSVPFPEPSESVDSAELVATYLDYFRATVEAKLIDLSYAQLTTSVLPSGWTPLELLKHLIFMERRWFVWGVEGRDVAQPWGDADGEGRWQLESGDTLDGLLLTLQQGGIRTRQILLEHDLSELAATGGRFAQSPPSLLSVALHVLQEYARHAGHLDVVRELIDGRTGK